jgi:hypothetical protein
MPLGVSQEGGSFYTFPKKLAVENYPVEIETSSFGTGTSKI